MARSVRNRAPNAGAGGSQPAGDREAPKADATVPRRKRFHVPTLAALASDARTLLVNAALLALFLLIVPVVAVQFLRNQVIIQPFPVPAELNARGLTPDVAANRLWDGLHEQAALAASSKEAVAALPTNQRVEFSVPDSGISIDALVYHVQQFFQIYQTRISGEFRCADADCTPEGVSLRIRVMRDQLEIIQMPPVGKVSESEYFRIAAGKVLDVLDPFTAAAARADTDPDAALVSAERMVRTQHADAVWAANLIGNIKLRQGDAAGAIAAYRNALTLKPDFVIASTNLGAALVQTGQLDEAEKVLAGLEASDDIDEHLALSRSKLAQARGDLDAAVDFLLQAETLDPGTARYYFLAGEAEYSAGRFDRAADYGTRALEVAPGDYGAVMLMSAVHAAQGSFELSEAVLARATRADPGQADFLGQHALLLHVLNRYPEALDAIDAALGLDPANTAWLVSRADILLSLNRAEEARAQAAMVTAQQPDNAQAWLIEGRALETLNRSEEARAAYQATISLDSGGYAAAAKGYLAVLDQTGSEVVPPG